MNTANNKSALLNNSFTSKIQENDETCNCLGCYQSANTKISLQIGKKSITILVCKDCKHKFKES
jgi:hypothetical protein